MNFTRHNPSDQLTAAMIAATRKREVIALELLGAIFADHRQFAPSADVQPHQFGRPDLITIYLAMLIGARNNWTLIQTLSLARAALRADHHWSEDSTTPPYGPIWCTETLAGLACSYFPWPAAVRHHAAKLVEAAARIEQAVSAYQRCRDLLIGFIDPDDCEVIQERRRRQGPIIIINRGAAA
jgi:hypothetical protein